MEEKNEFFVWVKERIDYLESIPLTEYGSGAINAYKRVVEWAKPIENLPALKPVKYISDAEVALIEEIRQIKAVIIHFATLDKMPTLELLNREGVISHVVERSDNILKKYPPKAKEASLNKEGSDAVDGWIRVEEKLPIKGQKVICIQSPITTATKEPLFAIFTGKYFIPPEITIFADFEVAQSKWVDITHWQPLPKSPINKV